MIRGVIGSRAIIEDRRWRAVLLSSPLMLAGMIALLLGGVLVALLLGGVFGKLGLIAAGLIIGTIFMAVLLVFRQDELAATVVIAVHLYVDWYVGLSVVAQVMTLGLLVIFFLARSPRYPWIEPRALWLWFLFLVLTILPALKGAANPSDATLYYPNIIFGAFIIFWLGTVIARDRACLQRLFKWLAGFAMLIAAHTIIQAVTGKTLFGTASQGAFLASVLNYQLGAYDVYRVGSFFVDPNWNGSFLAMMFFISLGLFFVSSSFLEKTLYLAEMSLILPALLFTYSNGAWIGTVAGLIAFIIFVGRVRYRLLLTLFILTAALVMMLLFRQQIDLQLQHAAGPDEWPLRVAGWQTAIQIIRAFPMTGIGLGHYTYLERAVPYHVLGEIIPLDHPHNSYLEFGAMAGLPVLLVFMALLLFALWLAFRNWTMAGARTRSLLGAGIAAIIALSVNSVSINAWTLPPLAATGWLILGAIASPLLKKNLNSEAMQEKNP